MLNLISEYEIYKNRFSFAHGVFQAVQFANTKRK